MRPNQCIPLLTDVCAAATPGPWYSKDGQIVVAALPLEKVQGWDSQPNVYQLAEVTLLTSIDAIVAAELGFTPEAIAANARLMAEARSAIPELLAYIARLERMLDLVR